MSVVGRGDGGDGGDEGDGGDGEDGEDGEHLDFARCVRWGSCRGGFDS
ncbi:hypothetical protein [Coleofasciculus chthonoplastes]